MLLRRGDVGDAVDDLRSRLENAGFPSFPDTPGYFGEATEKAVRLFQESRNLRVDGLCGPHSWAALVEAGYRLGDRLVYLKSPMLRGEDVADLQRQLGSLGFDTGRVDGIFGPETEAALSKFQRNVGLPPDGILGRASLDELTRLVGRGGGPSLMAEVKEREALRSRSRTLSGHVVTVGHGIDLAPVASEVVRLLESLGVTALAVSEEGSRQAARANEAAASLHLALETRGEGGPFSVHYYSGFSYESTGGKKLAQILVVSLASLTSMDPGSRPGPPSSSSPAPGSVSGMSIPVLRETRMPAVVVELQPSLLSESGAPVASAIVGALVEWAAEEWE